MTRAAVLCLVLGCGGGKRAEPTPVPQNFEPTPSDASVPVDACPRQCMDTCCRADEICRHGGDADGTYAKCIQGPM